MSRADIERLADAWDAAYSDAANWSDVLPGKVKGFDRLSGVRAILKALREPSEGMMAANLAARTGPWVTPLAFWQATIDHLLSESD